MFRRASFSLLACVGLLAASACKSEPAAPPPQAPETTAGTTTAGTTAETSGQFTAGDTFGVMRALHSGEIEQGMLAQKKASDPRVRAYAEKVVNHHKERMAKDNQLMSGLGISARDNDISNTIKSGAARQNAQLESLSGTDFDKAYLDNQIAYYRMALDTFDKNLLPNARDPQIRASLNNAREKANDNLREAQDLRNSIAMSSPMK